MAERLKVDISSRPMTPAWAEELMRLRNVARSSQAEGDGLVYGQSLVYRAALLQEPAGLQDLVTALDQLLGELSEARDVLSEGQAQRWGLAAPRGPYRD